MRREKWENTTYQAACAKRDGVKWLRRTFFRMIKPRFTIKEEIAKTIEAVECTTNQLRTTL